MFTIDMYVFRPINLSLYKAFITAVTHRGHVLIDRWEFYAPVRGEVQINLKVVRVVGDVEKCESFLASDVLRKHLTAKVAEASIAV